MKFIITLYHSHQRRIEADNRGWAALGRLLREGHRWSETKINWEIRRMNRIYRLVRGSGNPWKA